ncbi:MAG: hypothetical protein JSV49_00300 [Thermoplasmata archaeon]|nr:MAG: hypothetical protein JSV49_00300 [Thermoplasmata archaeon]
MTNNINLKKQKRLIEIEDRKIEIVMEIASINDLKNKKVLQLNSEYAKLHEEYYHLKLDLIREKQKE